MQALTDIRKITLQQNDNESKNKEILSRKQDVGFAQISNKLLNDEKLSLKAKGLYAYMFSKPNGWQFSAERMAKENSDKESAIWSGLIELEEKGYIKRNKLKTGRMEYLLLIKSRTKPYLGNPIQGKSQSGKTTVISNTDKDNNTDKDSNISLSSKIEILPENEPKVANEINQLIKCFKDVNPCYDKLFANKTERNACEYLIKKFSFGSIRSLVEGLKNVLIDKYAPRITKPSELQNKMGALKLYMQEQCKPKIHFKEKI